MSGNETVAKFTTRMAPCSRTITPPDWKKMRCGSGENTRGPHRCSIWFSDGDKAWAKLVLRCRNAKATLNA